MNTTTPDGHQVDGSGAWVVNGQMQTQGGGSSTENTGSYDSNYPLKGYVEAFGLLDDTVTTERCGVVRKTTMTIREV